MEYESEFETVIDSIDDDVLVEWYAEFQYDSDALYGLCVDHSEYKAFRWFVPGDEPDEGFWQPVEQSELTHKDIKKIEEKMHEKLLDIASEDAHWSKCDEQYDMMREG